VNLAEAAVVTVPLILTAAEDEATPTTGSVVVPDLGDTAARLIEGVDASGMTVLTCVTTEAEDETAALETTMADATGVPEMTTGMETARADDAALAGDVATETGQTVV